MTELDRGPIIVARTQQPLLAEIRNALNTRDSAALERALRGREAVEIADYLPQFSFKLHKQQNS